MGRRSILPVVVLLAAALTIVARLAEVRPLEWTAKPLASLAVLVLALTAAPWPSARYRGLIVSGLLCSLAGDVLLMLPGDLFLPGLAAFLAAHLCYLTAFRSHDGGMGPLVLLAPIVLVGAVVLTVLWPVLGAMRLPVLVYVAVILSMCWAATGRWWTTRAPGSGLSAIGAVLFVASDALLAFDRFHAPLPMAPLLVLGAYYAAQLLIASSVGATASH